MRPQILAAHACRADSGAARRRCPAADVIRVDVSRSVQGAATTAFADPRCSRPDRWVRPLRVAQPATSAAVREIVSSRLPTNSAGRAHCEFFSRSSVWRQMCLRSACYANAARHARSADPCGAVATPAAAYITVDTCLRARRVPHPDRRSGAIAIDRPHFARSPGRLARMQLRSSRLPRRVSRSTVSEPSWRPTRGRRPLIRCSRLSRVA